MTAKELAQHGSAVHALSRLGLALPAPVTPSAQYLPVTQLNGIVFVSGQLPRDNDGNMIARGLLGADVDMDTGRLCAQRCALNLLAQLSLACGDLDSVRLLKLQVFVASAPGFDQQHIVANGASDLFVEVLGDRGRHARSALGVASLPFGAPVEVEAIAAFADSDDT